MAIRDAAPAGAPCWADLWTTDVEGSRAFYSRLFGWDALEPAAAFGGYWMFSRGGAPVAGGMGSMGDLVADNTCKPYFCTRDMDVSLKRAEAGGAAIQAAAMAVADLGVQSVLTDPAGAVFGLWQPGTFQGFSVMNERGSPSWLELHTREHAAKGDFYRDLFEWTVDSVGDSDEFRYATFRTPGSEDELGGIMDSSRWLSAGGDRWDVHWHVDDATTTAGMVEALGGSVVQRLDRTPYDVLVLVLCADPSGVRFKLREPPAHV